MTLLSHPWPARYLPTDGDQQRLAAALEGLCPVPRETLLRALAQVDPQTVSSWLEMGTLREWVKQGLHILAEKGERGDLLATSLFTATPTLLPTLTAGEIGEWVRLGLDIEAADRPGVFSVLPDSFAALAESERLSLYRLARAAAYRSPQAAAASNCATASVPGWSATTVATPLAAQCWRPRSDWPAPRGNRRCGCTCWWWARCGHWPTGSGRPRWCSMRSCCARWPPPDGLPR